MTSPRDPAGLLERIPELTALTRHPSIVRAIERGDPHAVYRALYFAKLRGRLGDQKEVADTLLRRRRLFLTPIKRAPVLNTVNGVGATVYGASEHDDSDGSYIKSHFLVFVFVPLLPLSQYLVLDAEGGQRGWRFLGKVPFSPALYIWRRLVSLSVVVGVLWAGFSAFQASRHNVVYVLNGLPIPVRATIGKHALEIPSEGRTQLDLDVGPYTLEAKTVAGKLVERDTLTVRGGLDVLAWNIAGAAPLYQEVVTYSDVAAPEAHPAPQVECGQRQVVFESVDHVFEDPPQSVQVKQGSTVTRRHVDVASGGARACLSWLENHTSGRADKRLTTLARHLAELQDYDLSATNYAAAMLSARQGDEAAIAWLKQLCDSHQESVDLHRLFQNYMLQAGKRDVMVAQYRARYAQKATDPDASYLLARLLPSAESIALLTSTLEQQPRHIHSLRALVYVQVQNHQFASALGSWKQLDALQAQEAQELALQAATAYVAQGEVKEALALLERSFAETKELSLRSALNLTYARIAFGNTGADPFTLQRQLGEDAQRPSSLLWTRVRAGAEVAENELALVEDSEAQRQLHVLWLAPLDAGRALAGIEQLEANSLGALDEEVWTLLYAEALRRDVGSKTARVLEGWPGYSPVVARAIARYLADGSESVELENAELGARAAMQFVRSRKADLDAAERKRLRAAAAQGAIVPGIVTRALVSWGG